LAYSLGYKKSVQRDLKQISKLEAERILDHIEQKLVNDPESNPLLKGRFAGLRRYRVGDYRVIYFLQENEICILRIGHHRDVYKQEI